MLNRLSFAYVITTVLARYCHAILDGCHVCHVTDKVMVLMTVKLAMLA